MKGDDFKIPGVEHPMQDPVLRSSVRALQRHREYESLMDDSAVKEVLADLGRDITQDDLDALFRSLELRGLRSTWDQHTTGFVPEPDGIDMIPTDNGRFASRVRMGLRRVFVPPLVGETWEHWLTELAKRRPVRPVLAMLFDAGVLGTAWSKSAWERVWEEKGWR